LFGILCFTVPLILSSSTNELFEFPKMFFVYYLGLTTIFVFALESIWSIRGARRISLPNKWVSLFVAGYIVSTVFSNHHYTSFWGYYTRFNGGLLSVLIVFGIYLIAKNVFNKEEFLRLLKIVLLSVVPVSIYGIVQYYGSIDIDLTGGEVIRVFSTFGQPNWLASYLSMLLLPVIYFTAISDRPVLRWFWSIVYLLGFACLWLTYSVSGLLAFIVGAVVLVTINFGVFRSKTRALSLLLVISIIFALLNLGVFKQRISDVYIDLQKTIVQHSAVFAQGEDGYELSDTGFIRTGIWRGTFDLIASSPKIILIGNGPETFPYAFPAFRPAMLNYSSEWDYVFNKPHNYYLELMSNGGLVVLIPYLLLISWSLKKRHPFITPALSAFYVANIFGWPSVVTALLFWMFLAYLEVAND
jgi:putative inorganic carbon (hco3(-)) transporter